MLKSLFSPQREAALEAKIKQYMAHDKTLGEFKAKCIKYANTVIAMSEASTDIGASLVPGHISPAVMRYSALHKTLNPTLMHLYKNEFKLTVIEPIEKYEAGLKELIKQIDALDSAKKFVLEMELKKKELEKNRPQKFKAVLDEANYNKAMANAAADLDRYAGALVGMRNAIKEQQQRLITDDGRMIIVDETVNAMGRLEVGWLEQKAILLEKTAMATNSMQRVSDDARLMALKQAELDILHGDNGARFNSFDSQDSHSNEEETIETKKLMAALKQADEQNNSLPEEDDEDH